MDWQIFLTLVAGHYLADFGLQTQFMALSKAKVFLEPEGFHALTAHAAIHGLVAGLLSGSFEAALIVAVTHWFIDFGKASEWLMSKLSRKGELYSINVDQFLHISVILLVVLTIV
jgi:hypothetical protein